MQKSRKMKIMFSSFLILFLLGFAGVYLLLNREERGNVLGLESDQELRKESVGIPYILSAAPLIVNEGELYEYVPRLVDLDTSVDELELELLDAPSWLSITNGVVSGVVPVGDTSRTYSFVLRVSDGYNSSSQKNHILVEEKDE